jgi:hypothetical protein
MAVVVDILVQLVPLTQVVVQVVEPLAEVASQLLV